MMAGSRTGQVRWEGTSNHRELLSCHPGALATEGSEQGEQPTLNSAVHIMQGFYSGRVRLVVSFLNFGARLKVVSARAGG
jgi:hypothetical protein